jgi:prepilin-type N-terminal cleavage/methylation domain-containing protein
LILNSKALSFDHVFTNIHLNRGFRSRINLIFICGRRVPLGMKFPKGSALSASKKVLRTSAFAVSISLYIVDSNEKSGGLDMPLKIDGIKKEAGMTLIEVLAALVLLSLLVVTLLSVFSTSGGWISGAGKKTRAVQGANSIMDTIKANSTQLKQIDFSKAPAVGGKIEIPNSESDGKFIFSLEQKQEVGGVMKPVEVFKIEVPAPASSLKATATINISRHDDSPYYNAAVISEGDRHFKDNLFNIEVKIKWEESGQSRAIVMSTIVGAQ